MPRFFWFIASRLPTYSTYLTFRRELLLANFRSTALALASRSLLQQRHLWLRELERRNMLRCCLLT